MMPISGTSPLERADRPADEVVVVPGLRRVLALALRGRAPGTGRWPGCRARAPRSAIGSSRSTEQPLDARHGGDRLAPALAVEHEQRLDQVGGRQHGLGDQPPAPGVLPQPAQAGARKWRGRHEVVRAAHGRLQVALEAARASSNVSNQAGILAATHAPMADLRVHVDALGARSVRSIAGPATMSEATPWISSSRREQRAIQAMARAFAAAELAPHAEALGRRAASSRSRRCARRRSWGSAGIYVREDVGGSGLTRLDAALLFEELAAGCTSTAAYLSIHNMVAWMVDRFGDDAQRRALAAGPCAHGALASYCLTEPGAGSDAASLADDRARATATATCSTAARRSSRAAASATSIWSWPHGRGGAGGISAILVEKGTPRPRLRRPGEEARLALPADLPWSLFDGCRVPAANRIGEEGQGFKIAMRRPRWRPGQHRRLLARCRPRLPRARRSPTSRSAGSSAGRSPSSSTPSSSSPTWRPSWRPRG